jgi:hypothetical protein
MSITKRSLRSDKHRRMSLCGSLTVLALYEQHMVIVPQENHFIIRSNLMQCFQCMLRRIHETCFTLYYPTDGHKHDKRTGLTGIRYQITRNLMNVIMLYRGVNVSCLYIITLKGDINIAL